MASEIRLVVVVPVRRVIGKILNELPVVAVRIVKVNALPVRMAVRCRGVLVACRSHPGTQRVDIIDFVTEMIDSGNSAVWRPALFRFDARLVQSDVSVLGA